MSSRPRVIHLADYDADYTGSLISMLLELGEGPRADGFEVSFVFCATAERCAWVDVLRGRGFDCVFLALDERAHGKLLSLMAQELSRRFRTPLTAAVAALLPDDGVPTILHSVFSSFDEAAAYAARARPSTRVLWHEQSLRSDGLIPRLTGYVKYRLIGRRVDRFLCVAPDVTASIRTLAGPDRVSFVPNAIDTGRFRPASVEGRLAARRALGISVSAKVPLQFGLDWHRKGGDRFLAAIGALRGSGEIVGVIVGEEEASSAVRRAGLGDVVRVVPPAEDVERLYAAADVVVSPSRREGMPLAMLEALASGVPVVASDIAGHAFVARSVSACVLTRPDASDLAPRIREVLDLCPERRQADAEAARAWVTEHGDLRAWGARIRRLYQELVGAEAATSTAGTPGR